METTPYYIRAVLTDGAYVDFAIRQPLRAKEANWLAVARYDV